MDDLAHDGPDWIRRLGAVSCGTFALAVPVYLLLTSSRDYMPYWIVVMFSLVVLGLLSGIAGIVASRGQGRRPILAIVGCALNLPVVVTMLLVFTVMFGHRS